MHNEVINMFVFFGLDVHSFYDIDRSSIKPISSWAYQEWKRRLGVFAQKPMPYSVRIETYKRRNEESISNQTIWPW